MPSYPIKGGWVQLDEADAHLLTLGFWHIAQGYVQATIDGRLVLLHRLVLGLSRGDPIVDHRDLDGLNNQRDNLRVATQGQNGMNREKRLDNTSGFKGVYFCRTSQQWRAEIAANKKRSKLGRFDTPVKAALAYDRAAIRLHGDFARTNFPRENYAIKKD